MPIISVFQEEETEIEIIEYTTTTSSKKEVIESKTPIISGQVVELGSRTKQSEVSLQKLCKKIHSAHINQARFSQKLEADWVRSGNLSLSLCYQKCLECIHCSLI